MNYRICWQSLHTGISDCGETTFTKEVAEQLVDTLNKIFVGSINHWIEAEEDYESSQIAEDEIAYRQEVMG